MALLSDAAAFYTWAATTWVFTASVVVAIVRCWACGRGLRVEDVFTGFRAPLLLVAALLSQVSLRLYTVRVSIPEVRRRAGLLPLPRSPLPIRFSLSPRICGGCGDVVVRSPWRFQRQRGGREAAGVNAAVERFLSDEAYVWPVGICMFCLVALLISRAYEARRRRTPPLPPPRPPPPPPPRRRRAVAGQRTGGCSVSVTELVLFLFCVWTCVYSFPVMVIGYMAATANGSGSTAA